MGYGINLLMQPIVCYDSTKYAMILLYMLYRSTSEPEANYRKRPGYSSPKPKVSSRKGLRNTPLGSNAFRISVKSSNLGYISCKSAESVSAGKCFPQ